MNKRFLARLGVGLGLANVALGLAAVAFLFLNGQDWRAILADGGWQLALSMSVLGAVVVARRPDHRLGWIYCAVGFFQGLASFAYQYGLYALVTRPGSLPGGPELAWLGEVAWMPGLNLLLTYALLLFPTGRLPSPRWRALGWLCVMPLAAFVPTTVWLWPYRGRLYYDQPEQLNPAGAPGVVAQWFFPLLLLCGLLCLASLAVRFRRAGSVERQQIKWLLGAASLVLPLFVVFEMTPLGVLLTAARLDWLLMVALTPAFPAAVGIAVLRHRLFDIDLLIRRTLVYAVLSGLLALTYFGGVVVLESILRPLTGRAQSPLVTVLSTLAIAALFVPLRTRVQQVIDRRFYRRKYDAARTLAGFAASARDETDLDRLSEQLTDVVDQAMQPAQVSLWLAKPRPPGGSATG